MAKILDQVQDLENEGYEFEAAEASFDLLVKKAAGLYRPKFERLAYRVNVETDAEGRPVTEATVKVRVGDEIMHTVSEGDGPVNALDGALRKALLAVLSRAWRRCTWSITRCAWSTPGPRRRPGCASSSNGATRDDVWGTVGVSENIIEASWLALVDASSTSCSRMKKTTNSTRATRESMTGIVFLSCISCVSWFTNKMIHDDRTPQAIRSAAKPSSAGCTSGTSAATSTAGPIPTASRSASSSRRRTSPAPCTWAMRSTTRCKTC